MCLHFPEQIMQGGGLSKTITVSREHIACVLPGASCIDGPHAAEYNPARKKKMAARMTLRKEEYEVRTGMTVRDALKKIGVQPDSVLPVRNGELITDDEILREGDRIRLIAVISGGA